MTSASPFELLPAIDLIGGRVVRLTEGDFERATDYGDEPVETARSFVEQGARWLHVVDLDGARAGSPLQHNMVASIVTTVGSSARCQVAGGLRTDADVAAALETGAARVVLSTAALRDPGFSARLVESFGPDRIVVAVDVRDGQAIGEGWRRGAAGVRAGEALRAQADAGVTTFAVTAIERDGLLEGPDVGLLTGLVGLGRGRVIASGGVTTIEDVLAVRDIGCAGAIVGRALYEGRLTLPEVIAALG